MKLISGNAMLNIISVHAPQVGCSQQEKDQFYENLESEMRHIPLHEELIIGGDQNGHVGKDTSNSEREHGGHGYGQQNPEGESILSFAQAYNLVVAITYFQKKDDHLITYRSGGGGGCSTIDYIITRREKLKNIKDCKVIPGECAITQYRIRVMDYKSSLRRMARPRKRKPQIRWWKMKKQEEKDAYTLAVMHKTLSDVDILDWQDIKQILVETAKEVCGETTGKGTYTEKETWWWQEETRKAVVLKIATFKQFQMNKSDENKEKFREANRASRKAVRIAKDEAYEYLYAKLDSREGIKMVYKLAKTRENRSKDNSDMPFINSLEGQILTIESDIIQRWLTYFEGLLNTENTRKQIESGLATEGPIDIFNENEVSEQLGMMGLDKATGPDDPPIEAVKILAKQDIVEEEQDGADIQRKRRYTRVQ